MYIPIPFSKINDFIFCPASIYFHNMYEGVEDLLYKENPQVIGTHAHRHIDTGIEYDEAWLSAIPVYVEKYGLYGKIDKYNIETHLLVECKNKITTIYDGYIFQLYAQYFGMLDAGYTVDKLFLYSISANKRFFIKKPEEDLKMLKKFEKVVLNIRNFNIVDFRQINYKKCFNCIYSNVCKWGV